MRMSCLTSINHFLFVVQTLSNMAAILRARSSLSNIQASMSGVRPCMSFGSTRTPCLATRRRTWCRRPSSTAWCSAVFTSRLAGGSCSGSIISVAWSADRSCQAHQCDVVVIRLLDRHEKLGKLLPHTHTEDGLVGGKW